jgi:hypothetical protein
VELAMKKVLIGVAVTALSASGAVAQGAPGTGNSTQISSGNRDQMSGFNRVASELNARNGQARKPGQPQLAEAVKATAADVVPGKPLRDIGGEVIGTIDSVDAEGAIVAASDAKIRVPLIAFGKDSTGLRLAISGAKFRELVAKASERRAAQSQE